MADASRALTSEELAAMLSTNAVVVRRTMAGLREAKLVRSTLDTNASNHTIAEAKRRLGCREVGQNGVASLTRRARELERRWEIEPTELLPGAGGSGNTF